MKPNSQQQRAIDAASAGSAPAPRPPRPADPAPSILDDFARTALPHALRVTYDDGGAFNERYERAAKLAYEIGQAMMNERRRWIKG